MSIEKINRYHDTGQYIEFDESGSLCYYSDALEVCKQLEAENAELKELIGYCITDMYKPSGKISKPTAIKLMKYMSDNDLLKH